MEKQRGRLSVEGRRIVRTFFEVTGATMPVA